MEALKIAQPRLASSFAFCVSFLLTQVLQLLEMLHSDSKGSASAGCTALQLQQTYSETTKKRQDLKFCNWKLYHEYPAFSVPNVV